jgi:hypothetical protein
VGRWAKSLLQCILFLHRPVILPLARWDLDTVVVAMLTVPAVSGTTDPQLLEWVVA